MDLNYFKDLARVIFSSPTFSFVCMGEIDCMAKQSEQICVFNTNHISGLDILVGVNLLGIRGASRREQAVGSRQLVKWNLVVLNCT